MDDYVFLIGRPPILEFIGFVKGMAVDGRELDDGVLAAEWRSANDRVRELEASEGGVVDNPTVGPVSEHIRPMLEAALADSSAKKTFSLFPSSWGTVELDRLIVYQKFINLRYVAELKQEAPTVWSPEHLAAYSTGSGVPKAGVRVSQSGPNIFAFTSPSEDLRFLDVARLDPSQVSGYVAPGSVAALVAVAVGFGPNFITVLRIGNRLILHNGSHRAYALRELGVTHVPCLVQHISRDDELELVGVPDLKANSDRYLKGSRPALLKDYFDLRLRKVVRVVRKHRLVQVQLGWQEGKVPPT